MQITEEAIEKAASEIKRKCCGSVNPTYEMPSIKKIILSHCQPENEISYDCTDEFADKIVKNDNLHRECIEEIWQHLMDIYNGEGIKDAKTEKEIISQILARHFTNYKEIKKPIKSLITFCTARINGLRECVFCLQKEQLTNYDMAIIHLKDCPIAEIIKVLGLEE